MQYGAIAAAVGAVFFLLVIYLRALASTAGAGGAWREASEAFARRLRKVLLIVVAIGLVSSAAGIVLQGAKAAGVSFWSALDSQIVERRARHPLRHRLGHPDARVARLRGRSCSGSLSAARRPVLRPASVGRDRPGAAAARPAVAGAARAAAGLPRDLTRARRARQPREADLGADPVRRAARARDEHLGGRARHAPVRPAGRHPPAGERRPHAPAGRHAVRASRPGPSPA